MLERPPAASEQQLDGTAGKAPVAQLLQQCLPRSARQLACCGAGSRGDLIRSAAALRLLSASIELSDT